MPAGLYMGHSSGLLPIKTNIQNKATATNLDGVEAELDPFMEFGLAGEQQQEKASVPSPHPASGVPIHILLVNSFQICVYY